MKYAYYPGCSLHSTAKEYDISAQAVCRALGIELQEIPGWICCGATSAHATSEILSLALPVANLTLAREMDLDVMVCCAACYSRLRTANVAMRTNDERHAQVSQVVGKEYHGEVHVRHLLDVLVTDYGLDKLQERVTRPLSGWKVAAYYGCLLTRPPQVAHFDNPENPVSMDRLAVALGAEALDWPYKTECCGASLSLTTRGDVVLKLCRDILQMAGDAGADCIMVACPLCQANLDLRQSQINKRYGTGFQFPILYFTQLIGLAFGMNPDELGLSKLLVSPAPLLKAKALAQEE